MCIGSEVYHYGNAITPEVLHEARRATSFLLNLLFDRGVFLIQYEGIGEEERNQLASQRIESGLYAGGMPVVRDGVITKEEAFRRLRSGERGYVPALMSEPLFVALKKVRGVYVYSTKEISSAAIGATFR